MKFHKIFQQSIWPLVQSKLDFGVDLYTNPDAAIFYNFFQQCKDVRRDVRNGKSCHHWHQHAWSASVEVYTLCFLV